MVRKVILLVDDLAAENCLLEECAGNLGQRMDANLGNCGITADRCLPPVFFQSRKHNHQTTLYQCLHLTKVLSTTKVYNQTRLTCRRRVRLAAHH